jgi:hypothetical protein
MKPLMCGPMMWDDDMFNCDHCTMRTRFDDEGMMTQTWKERSLLLSSLSLLQL